MTASMRTFLSHVPILFVFAAALFTGIRGIDYGYHWDEDRITGSLSNSLESGIFLPRWYNYPSVPYDLALLSLAPELIRYHNPYRFSPQQFKQPQSENSADIPSTQFSSQVRRYADQEMRLRQTVVQKPFLLRLRIIFLTLSLLSVFWVYLTVYFQRHNWKEAFLAGALLGFSWEIAYHSRWIAPDALLMQFGALSLLFATIAVRHNVPRMASVWLGASAAAAGLACASKYQGGLLLVLVFVPAYLRFEKSSPLRTPRFYKRCLLLFLVFSALYLLTTPGTIVEFYEFIHDVHFEINHYHTGHWGHTAGSGFHHFLLIAEYFAFSLFSSYAAIALCFTIFILPGIFSLFSEDKRYALFFLIFPVLYILYMSSQNVMLVRNLLIVAPFLCILSARGAAFLVDKYCPSRIRSALAQCAILALLTIHVYWLFYASETIHNRGQIDFSTAVLNYREDNPTKELVFSRGVEEQLDQMNYAISAEGKDSASKAALALFYASEAETPQQSWPANRFNTYSLLPVGPYEVNYNYYPDWLGDDRIIILPLEKARRLGVPFP